MLKECTKCNGAHTNAVHQYKRFEQLSQASLIDRLESDGRLEAVTVQILTSLGVVKFGWVSPGEEFVGFGGATRWPNGAFVYVTDKGMNTVHVLVPPAPSAASSATSSAYASALASPLLSRRASATSSPCPEGSASARRTPPINLAGIAEGRADAPIGTASVPPPSVGRRARNIVRSGMPE